MADERPNPITKAAESSSLPRQARARIGATTDPVPEGKALDAAPELHFKVERASHDVARAEPKSGSELGLPESALVEGGAGAAAMRPWHAKEVAQAHPEDRGKYQHRNDPTYRKDTQAGMDWMGTSTAANKRMDSRHRSNDFIATSRGHSKHHDSVTRSGK